MIDSRLQKIQQLAPAGLQRQESFELVNTVVDDYYDSTDIGNAVYLWRHLEKQLRLAEKNGVSQLSEQYRQLMNKLFWVCGPFLPESVIEYNLEHNVLFALEQNIDIVEKFTPYFEEAINNQSELDRRRKLFLRAIKNNEEMFGPSAIEVDDDKIEQRLKHWLNYYDQSTSLKRIDRLSIVEFINSDKNVKKLSNEQRLDLRELLELYDTLKFVPAKKLPEERTKLPQQKIQPPVDPYELLKRPVSSVPVNTVQKNNISKGKSKNDNKQPAVLPTNRDVGSSAQLQDNEEILKAYRGDDKENRKVASEEQAIEKLQNPNLGKLFFEAVQKNNSYRALASLRMMAREGRLVNFLQEDKRLNTFLSNVWQKQFGTAFVAAFQKNPTDPKYVRQFLRYVLEERLEYDEPDAARIALHIGNIIVSSGKKGYNRMAYFNVKTKKFEWFDN